MDVTALVLISLLIATEAFSRILAWKGGARIPGEFAIPVTSLPVGLTFVLFLGAVVADLAFISLAHPAISAMASGAVLFMIGWVLRYPGKWRRVDTNSFAFIGDWVSREQWQGSLSIRHQRYLGLLLEISGLCLISLSPIGLAIALVTPLIIVSSAQSEEDFAISRWLSHGNDFWPYQRMTDPLLLRLEAFKWILPAPILVALATGFATRELQVFSADVDTAQTLLLAFAGAQGTALIFVLSALIVGMQLMGESYSWRVVRPVLLSRLSLLLTYGGVLFSILVDVAIVARSGEWLTGDDTRAALVDEAGLLAFVATSALFIAALSISSNFNAELAMAVLLRRIRPGRLESAAANWSSSHFYTSNYDDPLVAVVDLLDGSIRRGDVSGFKGCVARLAAWFEKVWPRGESPRSIRGWGEPGQPRADAAMIWPESRETQLATAMDSYVCHHMMGVIRRAAHEQNPDFIDGIYRLVATMYDRAHPYIDAEHYAHRFQLDVKGERLIREVIENCVRFKKIDPGRSAIHAVCSAGERLIRALPAFEETGLAEDPTEPPPEKSAGQLEHGRRARRRCDVFHDAYGGYLADVAGASVEAGATGIIDTTLFCFEQLIKELVKSDLSASSKRVSIGRIAFSHSRAIAAILASDIRIDLRSPFAAAKFDVPDGSSGDDVCLTLCSHEALFLDELHRNGSLSQHMVEDAAVLLREMIWRGNEGNGSLELGARLRILHTSITKDPKAPSELSKTITDELGQLGAIAKRRKMTALSNALQTGKAPKKESDPSTLG